jgi:GNAT superfamily N-acetyltransferase
VNLDKVVGCLLYDPVRSRAQFYVKPAQRRKGIAGQLLKRLRGMENFGNRVIEAVQGYPGSMEFFGKHFVYVADDAFSEAEINEVAIEIRMDANDTRKLTRWSAIHEIQIRRKRAFRLNYMKVKKAGLI